MKVLKKHNIVPYAEWTNKLEKRNLFPQLTYYLEKSLPGRVCLLSGLKRTGKTVMMLQALFLDIEHSAYIHCEQNDTLNELSNLLDSLPNEGINKIFIDEITILKDFIDNSQFIADIDAMRSKIVLSGTDSLAMWFAKHTVFSGRAHILRTTRIPFSEHCRLLGTTTLDDYARCGGILTDVSEFANYPLEAIAFNIQRSLANYRSGTRFAALEDLYENDLLTTFIQKVIFDENHRFIGKILTDEEWKLSDLTQARNKLANHEAQKIANALKIKPILQKVKERLGIVNDGKIKPSFQESWQLMRYLYELDIIEPCFILEEEDLRWEKNDNQQYQKIFNKLSLQKRLESPKGPWTLTQPGLRWAQIDVLLKTLQEEIPVKNPEAVDFLFKRIRETAIGHIMEDIIVSETRMALKDKAKVFKYRPFIGEIDMVVRKTNQLELYEIKHASTPNSSHWKNLNEFGKQNTPNILEQRLGNIVSKNILYTGEEQKGYINAAKYLQELSPDTTPTPDPTHIIFMPGP